jgi:hypothetical protein
MEAYKIEYIDDTQIFPSSLFKYADNYLTQKTWVVCVGADRKISPSYSQSNVTDATEYQEVLPVPLVIRYHVSYP